MRDETTTHVSVSKIEIGKGHVGPRLDIQDVITSRLSLSTDFHKLGPDFCAVDYELCVLLDDDCTVSVPATSHLDVFLEVDDVSPVRVVVSAGDCIFQITFGPGLKVRLGLVRARARGAGEAAAEVEHLLGDHSMKRRQLRPSRQMRATQVWSPARRGREEALIHDESSFVHRVNALLPSLLGARALFPRCCDFFYNVPEVVDLALEVVNLGLEAVVLALEVVFLAF